MSIRCRLHRSSPCAPRSTDAILSNELPLRPVESHCVRARSLRGIQLLRADLRTRPRPRRSRSGRTNLPTRHAIKVHSTYWRQTRKRLRPFSEPVLIEGSSYQGVWLECAPHEGLVYSNVRPDIARNNHLAFFRLQRADGWLPCSVKNSGSGFGQVQMVVPIAATAWELARQTGDDKLLEEAYGSCARWDGWLVRYRNTRGSGLREGFCTYDTGHDNSPRWAGLPNRCPQRGCTQLPANPFIAASMPRSVGHGLWRPRRPLCDGAGHRQKGRGRSLGR